MEYNVGDRVRVKSLDWYNENKDEYGNIDINCDFTFYADRSKYSGKVLTISEVFDNCYGVIEDNNEYYWIDEMFEGCVDSVEDRIKELRKMCTISLTDSKYTDKVEVLLNDYEYIEENGKAFFVKKKKYPKTYEECCDKINFKGGFKEILLSDDEYSLYIPFIKLKRCRDAYWKIAGDEMGLEKPWKPDWTNEKQSKYGLYEELKNTIINPALFVFPTEEMRDKFYENFKDDFNKCRVDRV